MSYASTTDTVNADASELAKFSALAHRWWDPQSEFKPLHAINPLRLNWIDSHAQIKGKRVLDVGCGGGILAESMAQRGAAVKGIDLADKPLKVAILHAMEAQADVQYEMIAAEALAASEPASFDVITCMEMLEHVPDPTSIVHACVAMLKPGGTLFFSTLNRNAKSFLFSIIGAEYMLKLLPKGTHQYMKYIKPHELLRVCRDAGLELLEIKGMSYNPFTEHYALNQDTSVNYLVALRKTT